MKSDILYISNQPITDNIIDGLHEIGKHDWKLKICGKYHVHLPEYLGIVDIYQSVDLMGSTKICLDYNHNILYDCAFNKVFCLTNKKDSLFPLITKSDEIFPNAEFLHYLHSETDRKEYANKVYKQVIENDTSFHRLYDIFSKINLPKLSELTMNTLKKII